MIDEEKLENIKEHIFFGKRLFFWGAGYYGRIFLNRNPFLYDILEGYIDIDKNKTGKMIYKKRIYHPGEIRFDDTIYVVITSKKNSVIQRTLSGLGLKAVEDYLPFEELQKLIEEKEGVSLRGTLNDVYFSRALQEIRSENINRIVVPIDDLFVLPWFNISTFFSIIENKSGIGEDNVFLRLRLYGYVGMQANDTVDNVYEKARDLSEQTAAFSESVKNVEMFTYEQYAVPDNSIREFIEICHNQGRKVILEYSFYHENIYKNLLAKYSIPYDELLNVNLQNDKKSVKETGESILFLDNYMDNECFFRGIDVSKKHPRCIESLYLTKRNRKLDSYKNHIAPNTGNEIYFGYTIQKIFSENNSCDYESNYDGSPEIFAKILIAPLLLEFVVWMLKDMESMGFSRLILVMRDGYLIKKIIDLLNEYANIAPNIEIKEAQLSRNVRMSANALDSDGFLRCLDYPVDPGISIEDFARVRLFAQKEEIKSLEKIIYATMGKTKDDALGGIENYASLYPIFNKIYSKNAKRKYRVLEKYCNELIEDPQKTAIFDIGYRGSVVRFLHKMNIDVFGYHLFAKSFMDNHDYAWKHLKAFAKYGQKTISDSMILHPLLEHIISSQDGSAKEILFKRGKFIVEKDKEMIDETVVQMQQAILSGIRDFLSITGKDVLLLHFDNMLEFEHLKEFLSHPNSIDAKFISKMNFLDSTNMGIPGCLNVYEKWFRKKCGMKNG